FKAMYSNPEKLPLHLSKSKSLISWKGGGLPVPDVYENLVPSGENVGCPEFPTKGAGNPKF
ncbi:MAG TPA: hypothetical protein PLO98_09295, partial [Bacteroidia bacterium]|nr:hypothetical protein [Bacteroidia bacterium]